MAITVRRMRYEEATAFLSVIRSAIDGTAAKDYPRDVIEVWGPRLPLTEQALEAFLANPEGEIRLVAEMDGIIVGIGVLVPRNSELRACYVAPNASRKGVGSALIGEIERVAREQGLEALQLASTVTAEAFYKAHGYEVRSREDHILSSGEAMASIKMRKILNFAR